MPEKPKVIPSPSPRIAPLHIVLGALLVFSHAGFWYGVRQAFTINLTETFRDPATILYFFFLLFLLGLVLALVAVVGILVPRGDVRVACFIASGAVFLLPFGVNLLTLIVVGIVALGEWWFGRTVQEESRQRLTFAPLKLTRHGYGTVALVLILGISLANYHVGVENREEAAAQRQASLVATGTTMLEQTLRVQFRGYDPDMTLDEFILQFVTIGGEGDRQEPQINFELPFSFGALPEGVELQEQLDAASAQITDETVGQIRQQLLDAFGIDAEGTETVHVVVERIVEQQLAGVLENVEQFMPLVSAIGLFFLLEVFTWGYLAVGRVLVSFLFALLFALKLIRLERVAASRQVVTVS